MNQDINIIQTYRKKINGYLRVKKHWNKQIKLIEKQTKANLQ